MSRGKRWLERFKSLLILLLAVNAVWLAWRTGLFQVILPAEKPSLPAEPSPRVYSYTAAALPVSAAVTGASGLVYGVACDDERMESLMNSFRSVLGETLGSASAPQEATVKEWRRALLGPGLFLDYGIPIPLEVLARWMGTSAGFAPEQQAERLLLSLAEENKVKLYYLEPGGKVLCCDTLAQSSALYTEINASLSNGAEFALQAEGLKDCDPYCLILRELPALRACGASDSGRDAALQKAAELCRINLNSGNRFQEQNGIVYLGEEGRLRLEADGSIHYTAAEGGGLGETWDEAGRIELSRSLLVPLAEACGGIGRLVYTGTERGEDTVRCRFDYRVQGMCVKLSSGSAGWAVFRNGRLTELGFRPRTYLPEDTVDRLPPLQAAAAAGSLQPGGTPELVYSDPGGEGRMEPVWTLRERSA